MVYKNGVSCPFFTEIVEAIKKVHEDFGDTPIDNDFVQLLIKLENYVINKIEDHKKRK